MTGAHCAASNLTDARFQSVDLLASGDAGVDLIDVEIHGEVQNLVNQRG